MNTNDELSKYDGAHTLLGVGAIVAAIGVCIKWPEVPLAIGCGAIVAGAVVWLLTWLPGFWSPIAATAIAIISITAVMNAYSDRLENEWRSALLARTQSCLDSKDWEHQHDGPNYVVVLSPEHTMTLPMQGPDRAWITFKYRPVAKRGAP